ncbi:MAG TPA: CBS domain-containing protein [Nitrososphaeraceae archaeon]
MNQKIGTVVEKVITTLDEDTIIIEAVKIMRDKGISSVYVTKSKKGYEKGEEPDIYPIGIVTERDILYRVVAENKGPYKVTIGEIMSSPIVAVDEGILIKDAISLMRRNHIRRLLVTGTKKNSDGIISMQDEKSKQSIKTISPIGSVTLMSIVGNMPEESLELAEVESPNLVSNTEQIVKIVCPYCESKFDNKTDLSKHIDRIHLGSGLLEGDVRKW